MNELYRRIPESTAEDRALAYYAEKIDARVAKMAKKDLLEWPHKNEDLWVRNFTCRRFDPLVIFGKQTRFPDMLKLPKFRQAVADKAYRAFRSHGLEVDSYICANKRLEAVPGEKFPDIVGSGYELRVYIKALPATTEDLFCEVHGVPSAMAARSSSVLRV